MYAQLPGPLTFPEGIILKRVKSFSPTTQSEVQLEFLQRGRLHPAPKSRMKEED